MKDCRKRQVERRNGETTHRCINRNAAAYKQPVDASVCDSCPVRVFMEQRGKKPTPPKPMALPVVDTSEMTKCDFRFNNSVQGLTCGMTGLPTDKDICNRCSKDTRMEPKTLLQKVVSYKDALQKWMKAGRPTRTQEEIDAIYAEHCSKCDMFDKDRKICNSCGCPSNTDQPAIRNKLKMATEACPLGRFPAKVET